MREYTYTDNGFTFERVNKRKAEAAYKGNLKVILCPKNLRPGWPWYPEVCVSRKRNDDRSWDSVLNEFEFYNGKPIFLLPMRKVAGKPGVKETNQTVKEYDYRYLDI